jgi:adenine-specific DNA-methyltransferase
MADESPSSGKRSPKGNSNSLLPLFGSLSAQETAIGTQGRKIGAGLPPPPHKPTKAIPEHLLTAATLEQQRVCSEKADLYIKRLTPLVGAPFYANQGFVLYQADCLDVLRALHEAAIPIDLTITSPPYNIGKEYETPQPLADYLAWCEHWMNAVHQSTKDNGAFWLNLGYVQTKNGKAVPLAYLLWNRSPFYLQQEIVWHYGAGVTTKRAFCPRNEKWLFFTKDTHFYTFNLDAVRDPNVKYPNQKKHGKYRCNPLGKNPSDVWLIPKVTTGTKRSSKERTPHPAQFPLRLIDRIVQVSSSPGDLVIDPFSGSGSAGIPAVAAARPYIGVDLRGDYCAVSARRFEKFLEARAALHQQPALPWQESHASESVR